ncbi:MAG: HYR domain-containing protein [Saprospirales bacterium]|nr:HYR domain-containing protein [Saprospirales bacterium]
MGYTEVTYTVTDDMGNNTSCTFTVTVEDHEAPEITCPADQTIDADANCMALVPELASFGTATDNCTNLGTITQDIAVGASWGGAHGATQVVTLTVVDASGNSASCEVVLTLNDVTNPMIVCNNSPTDLTANLDCSYLVPDTGLDPTVFSDNCPSDDLTLSHNYAPAPHTNTLNGALLQVGNTEVTWTVTDANGNTETCTVIYSVSDDDAPVALCIMQMDALLAGDGSFQITPAMLDMGSYDNCGVVDMEVDISSVDCSDAGNTVVVTLFVYDGANVATCTTNVDVWDVEVPQISCPGNIFVENDPGDCDATINADWLKPTYKHDNCDFSIKYKITDATSAMGNGNVPGSTQFNVGSSMVTYTITDDSGNKAKCSFFVVVEDDEAPVATNCPNSFEVNSALNLCGQFVNYPTILFDDNCAGSGLTGVLTEGLSSGSIFPVGTTTVTWSYTDPSGNVGECSFDVTVIDVANPTISCPQNVVVQILEVNGAFVPQVVAGSAYIYGTGPCGITLGYNPLNGANAADNCGVEYVLLQYGNGPTPQFYEYGGYYTETWIAIDEADNTASCSFTITIDDLVNPGIVCPSDMTVYTDPNLCTAVVNYSFPYSTDNCPGYEITQLLGPNSGEPFDLGLTTVEFEVTDDNGNSATCSFEVTVVDAQAPIITACAPDQNVFTSTGLTTDCGGLIPDLTDELTVSDNCTALGNLDITQVPGVGVTFTGQHGDELEVVITVEDAAGNTSSCTTTLTLIDDQAPTIDCAVIPDEDLSTNSGYCWHQVSGTGLDPDWSDNCNAILTHDYAPAPSEHTLNGAILPKGTTTVTWTITDENGNSASCNATYTVVDDTPPVALCIEGPIDAMLEADGSFQITPAMLDAGSYDNCGYIDMAVDVNYVGCDEAGQTIEVTLTVSDGPNASICTVDVDVWDLELPEIQCPGNLYVANNLGECYATIPAAQLNPVYANDNCDFTIEHRLTGATTKAWTNGNVPGNTHFNVGVTRVRYRITDASGNEAICEFWVFVTDEEPPTVDCSNIDPNRDATLDQCDYTVQGDEFDPGIVDDNCPGVTLTNDYNNTATLDGAVFPVGSTNVTWTATDAAGNTSTCEVTIVISDVQDPVITCAIDPFEFNTVDLECETVIIDNSLDPIATDNCPGVTISHDYLAGPHLFTLQGAIFPVGSTTVNWTATDAAGNTATCSIEVIVTDGVPPVALCIMQMDAVLGPDGSFQITPAMLDAGSFDNCGYIDMAVNIDYVGCDEVGQTVMVTLIVSDGANASICQTAVDVWDATLPTMQCQDITVVLDENGAATITADDVDGGSFDNCDLVLSIDDESFNCDDVGDINVTLTGVDPSGNEAQCVATVTVIDILPPTFTCPATPQYVDGCDDLVPDLVAQVTGEADNCGYFRSRRARKRALISVQRTAIL